MNIIIYQAECGDAARINFKGTDGKQHNICIDSGYGRTFTSVIKEDFIQIEKGAGCIDLWIISHIHDDHIGGVLRYIKAIKSEELTDIVNQWWYNIPRTNNLTLKSNLINPISEAQSIKQGDDLTNYLSFIQKLSKTDITTSLPSLDVFGLKLQVLSPGKKELSDLRKKYLLVDEIDYQETTKISEACFATGDDYDKRIDEFDLDSWSEDDCIENGSSISVLIEFEGKKTLWLADSFPSVIVKSLNNLGYSSDNTLACEYVKVTHHGSKANNSSELYSMIQSNNYIISANGENNNYLPTKECLSVILRNPRRLKDSHYNFYFTYDNDALRNIFTIDGKDVYKKWNFTTHFQSSKSLCFSL